MAEPLLGLEGVRAGYGDAVVLDDVSLEVREHGSLAVLGRNGVGKTTLLLTLMGYTRLMRGAILWRSEEHTSELQSRPHLVCRLLLEKKKQTNSQSFSAVVTVLTRRLAPSVHVL